MVARHRPNRFARFSAAYMGDARQRHTLRSGTANVLAQYRPNRFASYGRSVHVRLPGNATQQHSVLRVDPIAAWLVSERRGMTISG